MTRDRLYWFILIVVVALAGSVVYNKYEMTRPCAQPIAYSIGAVDSRFDISTATLKSDLATAAQIWNKAAGKTVLKYDPTASLAVNLVYDEREATAKLGVSITRAQEQADTERTALDAKQADFIGKQDAYNQKVEAINTNGGATPPQARTLEAERARLIALASDIQQEVSAYNQKVASLNALIEEFNQSAGRTFEEGQYGRDANGERINIFEFIGDAQLERVLAHEFGHAIGLDHNDNPASIMYARNESGNLVPTTDDLAALHALCGA